MTEQELELKYGNMTHQQVQEQIGVIKQEERKLESSIAALKIGLLRKEAVLLRLNTINDDISHHEKELKILRKQKKFAEQEARVLRKDDKCRT